MRLAEGDVEEERLLASTLSHMFVHNPDGLGCRPGGHVIPFRKHARAGRIGVVGNAGVPQAKITPALFSQPGQVVIPKAWRQETALLVGDEQVEAVGHILRIDVAFANAVGPVPVTLKHPAERIRLVPGQHVVEADHPMCDRQLPTEQCAPSAHTGWHFRDSAWEVVSGSRQGVDAGRMHGRMARDAQGIAAVLIGRDEDDVGSFGFRHVGLLLGIFA